MCSFCEQCAFDIELVVLWCVKCSLKCCVCRGIRIDIAAWIIMYHLIWCSLRTHAESYLSTGHRDQDQGQTITSESCIFSSWGIGENPRVGINAIQVNQAVDWSRYSGRCLTKLSFELVGESLWQKYISNDYIQKRIVYFNVQRNNIITLFAVRVLIVRSC